MCAAILREAFDAQPMEPKVNSAVHVEIYSGRPRKALLEICFLNVKVIPARCIIVYTIRFSVALVWSWDRWFLKERPEFTASGHAPL